MQVMSSVKHTSTWMTAFEIVATSVTPYAADPQATRVPSPQKMCEGASSIVCTVRSRPNHGRALIATSTK